MHLQCDQPPGMVEEWSCREDLPRFGYEDQRHKSCTLTISTGLAGLLISMESFCYPFFHLVFTFICCIVILVIKTSLSGYSAGNRLVLVHAGIKHGCVKVQDYPVKQAVPVVITYADEPWRFLVICSGLMKVSSVLEILHCLKDVFAMKIPTKCSIKTTFSCFARRM